MEKLDGRSKKEATPVMMLIDSRRGRGVYHANLRHATHIHHTDSLQSGTPIQPINMEDLSQYHGQTHAPKPRSASASQEVQQGDRRTNISPLMLYNPLC